jgi:hypothetical protein
MLIPRTSNMLLNTAEGLEGGLEKGLKLNL